jgi:hypothetical protein
MKKHAAPIIVALLLILPVLYLGSYCALVVPGGIYPTLHAYKDPGRVNQVIIDSQVYYRSGGSFSAHFFWPLEQIDRKMRPHAWVDVFEINCHYSGVKPME